MSMHSQLSFKLALTSQAAATMGEDPAWDAAVSDFLRTYSLWQADEHFGAFAKADDDWETAKMSLERVYGKGWDQNPAASVEADQRREALRAAEDLHHKRFVAPYWKALRDLTNTPAPTLAAACFKGLLVQSEEVWNDSAMDAECMRILENDFDRLAA